MRKKKEPKKLTPKEEKKIAEMRLWANLDAEKHPKEFFEGMNKYWFKHFGLDR